VDEKSTEKRRVIAVDTERMVNYAAQSIERSITLTRALASSSSGFCRVLHSLEARDWRAWLTTLSRFD